MRLSTKLLLPILGWFACFCVGAAEAHFTLPRPYVVYLFDGAPLKKQLLSEARQLPLAPGRHQLVVRFENSYKSAGDTDLIAGEPLVVDFTVKGGEALTLAFDYPRTLRAAEAFLQTQPVTLVDAAGKAYPAEIKVMPKKEGLQIGRDYKEELMALGWSFDSLPLPQTAPALSNQTVTTASSSTQTMGDAGNKTLEALKQWYLQADPATRKAFQHWIISQQ
ncbi:DUF2057 domain-containing protein [Pseudaeromonas paramecii]|uniref:DUF2057 domain-containing protein n=1 Tax=Pseudaeromonas paramecii TaxID=2138166 RepID=A0ABP8PVQ0_9GAMM